MIIILITIVLLLICTSILVLMIISNKLEYDSKLYKFYVFIDDEGIAMLWVVMYTVSILATIICAILIIDVNSSVKDTIYDNNIKYYDICNKAENVVKNSTEEELVKSEIIEWNHEVLKYKSGYNNPWVSWFYNKEVLDNMDYIEYPGIEVPEEIR